MRESSHREIQILLVEDSPSDADFARRALCRGSFSVHIQHAHDGAEAMAMLRRQEPYSDAPRPDLILLDLNMPRMDGRQVLREIQDDNGLKTIPVIVLTTSVDDGDIRAVYALGGKTYIVKPVDLEEFFAAVECIQQYWFKVATLPPQEC